MAGSGLSGAIGVVASVSGGAASVCIEGVEVIEKDLQPDAELFPGQVLRTSEHARVTIALVDGTRVTMRGGVEVELNREGIEALREQADEEGEEDIDAMQAALLAGIDPSELEATAAGPGAAGSEGNTSFVILKRSDQRGQVDPTDLDSDPAPDPQFAPGRGSDAIPGEGEPGSGAPGTPPGLGGPGPVGIVAPPANAGPPNNDDPAPPPPPPNDPPPPPPPPDVPPPPPPDDPPPPPPDDPPPPPPDDPPPPPPDDPPPPPPDDPPPPSSEVRTLSVGLETNTPAHDQVLLFTFGQPVTGDFFWTLVNLNAQGGTLNLNEEMSSDVGFAIDFSLPAEITLEWMSGASNTQLRRFDIDGANIRDAAVKDGVEVAQPKLVGPSEAPGNSSQGDTLAATLEYDNGVASIVDGESALSFAKLLDDDPSDGLIGTAGNDVFDLTDIDFDGLDPGTFIDGEGGVDMLVIDEPGMKSGTLLDLSEPMFTGSDLEVINLSVDASGGVVTDNTVVLSAQDVLDLGSTSGNKLYIMGDDADSVWLTDYDSWNRVDGDTARDGWVGFEQEVAGETVSLYVQFTETEHNNGSLSHSGISVYDASDINNPIVVLDNTTTDIL